MHTMKIITKKDSEKNKILVSIVGDVFPSFKFLYVILLAYSFLN